MAGGEAALKSAEEGVEDDAGLGRRDVEALGGGEADLVVGVSASGRTPYTLEALRAARERGAATACVVNVRDSEMGSTVDHAVEVVTGAEVLAGSTRLKAGTAQKMVLNMISTGAMAGVGYVYEDLMVGVMPTNAKLRERARRIVCEITGRDEEEARRALERSGYDVRLAVLLLDGSASVEEARRRLREASGSLRRAREYGP
jgi:N-acetylmuramic acid 6-phosphate etherase